MPNWNLTAAKAVSTNAVRLTFDLAMEQTNATDLGDALNPENYKITIFTGAGASSGAGATLGDGYQRRVSQVDKLSPVDLTKVDVRFWPSLDSSAATYQIEAGANILGDTGEARGTTFTKTFSGLDLLKVSEPPEKKALGQDFKNDPFTGKFSLTDQGDFAKHDTIEYLKKRIFRRLVTTIGGFSHLPDFGEGLPLKVKRIVTPSEMRVFKNSLRQGLLKDTDVKGLEIAIEQQDMGIMKVYLKVKTAFGLEFEQQEAFTLE